MSDLKFTGVWIPKAIFQSTTISTSAKMLYGIIAGLDGDDGCFASNAYLQSILGVSERGIQTLLAELDEQKVIVRSVYRNKRVIRTVEGLALEGCKNLRGGVQNSAGEGCKKLHPYIIEDKIEDNNKVPPVFSSALPFESEQFAKAWAAWQDYRKELKKPLKPTTVKAQWKQFILWGERKSIESINMSIQNGWTGLFEPKGATSKPLTAQDHNEF